MAVSYWCVPSAEDAGPYKSVINALAEEQGGFSFQPHLTLGTLTHAAPGIEEIAAALNKLVLQPVAIDASDVFTKSLFVRFGPSDALLEARGLLEKLPGFRQGRTFDPHISLCYGRPPRGSQARSDVRSLLNRPVRFDALAAVDISLPVSDYANVAAWTVFETHRT